MGLAEFLKARLDEDEAEAKLATADPGMSACWNETTSGCLDVGLPDHGGQDWTDYVWPQGDSRVTRFIAEHDPARVLREVAAKRAILALHYRLPVHKNGPLDDSCICQDYGGVETGKWPCDTLRALATAWSDHPDYRDEWKA